MGDRDAFAQIVARYQALVASIAYNATGSLARSEDLAQETFLAAWRHLPSLAEPAKLRGWICGIARNLSANSHRRSRREPVHDAEPLETAVETPTADDLPSDQAISREEEAILWRSIEQIPAPYREPLILFYRDGQSAERVAELLELSPDTVRQRLSRGRKLLEARVTAFVERTLRRSAPGQSFTAGVMAVLPAQVGTAGLASLGTSVAKGGLIKAGAFGAVLTTLISFLPGAVAAFEGYRRDLEEADSLRSRRWVRRFYGLLAATALVPVALIYVAVAFRGIIATHPRLFVASVLAIGVMWIPAAAVLLGWIWQRNQAASTPGHAERQVSPVLEYRSAATLFGLPLVHVRFGGSTSLRRVPVKAWIAFGDIALGGLIAMGGVAVAPLCAGGFALGAVVFGGFSVGLFAFAGFGLGVWVIGGFVAGVYSVGGCAIAARAALGGIAVAREIAVGGLAFAHHANDETANAYLRGQWFFQHAYLLVTRWLWPTMIAATIPSVVLHAIWRRKRHRPQS